jgi:hypothetical protein
MSKDNVTLLLREWTCLVAKGEEISKEKAGKSKGGLLGRIKRTRGHPVVFDFETHNAQLKIQEELCSELPAWADVIRSQPEIMDGWAWTRGDFIELYYSHFRLVIEKLQEITRK